MSKALGMTPLPHPTPTPSITTNKQNKAERPESEVKSLSEDWAMQSLLKSGTAQRIVSAGLTSLTKHT